MSNPLTIEEIKRSEAECAEKSKELKTSLAATIEKLNKTSKASPGEMEDSPDDEMEDMKEMCSSLAKYIDYVDQRVSRAFDSVYQMENNHYKSMSEHRSGHMPAMTPSQMNKVFSKCGLDGDFVVAPATIYASRGSKNSSTIEVEWINK